MNDPVVSRAIPLEQREIYTLLGIRFWDPVTDDQVRYGLQVTAWPEGQAEAGCEAFRTGGGIYAFRGLAGMRALEFPEEGADPWSEPTVRFIVQVLDSLSRYQPLVFAVNVPFRGVFPTAALYSPEGLNAAGCWLFSAPTRTIPAGFGVVRAQLAEAFSDEPAAYAVLGVEIAGETWYGISGNDGQVTVVFPVPDFTSLTNFTSPVSAVPMQSWPLTTRVRYAPSWQETPVGALAPNVRSLFDQPTREIWLTDSGATGSALNSDFVFGEELILRTAGQTTLWLEPEASPL